MNQDTKFELPTILVIFGITGDLVKSKILVSLFRLYKKKLLPEKFKVLGFSRRDFDDQKLREYLKELFKSQYKNLKAPEDFFDKFFYIKGNFDNKEAYKKLAEILGHADGKWHICSNKLFYLAVPPAFYRTIVRSLHDSGLTLPCSPQEGWTRVILEKPFGRDLKSATELDLLLGKLFREEQIYRVDHYLVKETTRNILAFRFSNSFLAPAWNNKYIEKIEFKLLEKETVSDRGEYYDEVGALRDVGQSHLLQLLALFTMAHPGDFTAVNIWKKRAEVLSALKIFNEKEVELFTMRGQYKNYIKEKGVGKKSKTETYFKLKAFIENSRWLGVPMYLESGKAMSKEHLEVVVTFRHQDPCLCPPGDKHYKNILRYQIQPHEKITTYFLVKKPGYDNILQQKDFEFDYKKAYRGEEFIEPYEKLLIDIIKGDQTLFVSTDEIFNQWKFVEPILQAWKKNKPPLFNYKKGMQIHIEVADDQRVSLQKKIGVIGLGKMGTNLSLQLLEKDWQVVGFNRSKAKTDNLLKNGLIGSYSLTEFVEKLPTPRIVWLLLSAGAAVDETIFGKNGLTNYLEKGDIIIDSGNSYYKDSLNRAKKLKSFGIKFLDVGISGGPAGARKGACLMIGGDRKTFDFLLPLFIDISVAGGVEFFEGEGAGHFVKMIHNGIEYGMMQAIAEGFAILKKSPYNLDLTGVAKIYNRGSVIESNLIEWLAQAFQIHGVNLKDVVGTVAHTGEGAWTVNEAKDLKIKAKIIEESFKFRVMSEKNPSYTGRVLSALRGQFGGHDTKMKNEI